MCQNEQTALSAEDCITFRMSDNMDTLSMTFHDPLDETRVIRFDSQSRSKTEAMMHLIVDNKSITFPIDLSTPKEAVAASIVDHLNQIDPTAVDIIKRISEVAAAGKTQADIDERQARAERLTQRLRSYQRDLASEPRSLGGVIKDRSLWQRNRDSALTHAVLYGVALGGLAFILGVSPLGAVAFGASVAISFGVQAYAYLRFHVP